MMASICAFSPDGQQIIVSRWSGQAQVWDANTGEAITPPLAHANRVYWTAFSPDGRWVLTASADKTARVWDAATGHPLTPPLLHNGVVKYAVFSPNGRFVLTASHDHTARVWDLGSLESHNANLYASGPGLAQAVFIPDGSRILTMDGGNSLGVWNGTDAQLIKHMKALPFGYGSGGTRPLISADGRWLVANGGGPEAAVWDATSFALAWQPRHAKDIAWISLSRDGRRVITASYDHTAQIWELATGRKLLPPIQHQGVVERALFSPDDARILTASRDRTARVWDTASGEPVTPPLSHRDEVSCAAFSRDGRWVITGCMDGTARIWDAASGAPRTPKPLEHTLAVTVVEFSPDDRLVLTASQDGVAQVWEAATGERSTAPLQHRDWIFGASFSPDGRLVVTAGWRSGARVWDAGTGEPVSPLLNHAHGINQATFSPDGERILTAGGDGAAHLWTLPRDDRSSEDWTSLAELLAASLIDSSGAVPLDIAGLSNRWQTLRAKYRAEFIPLTDRTPAWHERQAIACEAAGRHWPAALFHLNRLLEVTPNDPALRKRRALAALYSNQLGPTHEDRALLFPPRDAKAGANLIDLGPSYTRAPENETNPRYGFSALPQGLQRFKGVDFDVRGMVQLSGQGIRSDGWRFPEQVPGIRVGQKARRLHFLQATTGGSDPDGTLIGSYVFHYAGGVMEKIALVHGREIRNRRASWNEQADHSIARPVWTGEKEFSDLRLFDFTWENPRPNEEVVSIDFISAMAQSAPFLVALTVEP